MTPLLLAGGALVAYLALSGASSGGTENMYFRDYAWVTVLPAGLSSVSYDPTKGIVGGPRTNLPLPAPPNITGPGAWHVFPGGNAIAPDGSIHPVYPNIPNGFDLYMWVPVVTNWGGSGNTGSVTQINGYFVTTATTDWFDNSPGASFNFGANVAQMPDPPGQSGGRWMMKHPGYVVYITPTNANESDAYGYQTGIGFALPTNAAAYGGGTYGTTAATQTPVETTTSGWPMYSAEGWYGGPTDFGGGVHYGPGSGRFADPGPSPYGGGFYQPR
jgi:hypothetical protein